jgi:hypothetical protein
MTEGIVADGSEPGGRLSETRHNPLEQLRRNMAATVVHAVDELHVAALLESRGVTDSVAEQKYGHHDVFTLAETLYSRRPIAGNETAADVSAGPRRWRKDLRMMTHGPLYMLPSTVYPAIIIALGAATVFRVLVFATALGWVWGMGASTVAYQLLGQGRERSAGQAIRLLSLIGIVVALLCGIVFAATGPGGSGLVLYVVAQVTFQLMSGILIFHGKELWLALTMFPAFFAGLILLVSGFDDKFVTPTLVTAGVCVVLLAATALLVRPRVSAQSDSRRQIHFLRIYAAASPSVCYAALCAFYFLNTEARTLNGGGALAIAGLPLILSLGVLEWRANRFSEKVRELFGRLASPVEFQGAARQLLLTELVNCLMVLGGLSAIFIFVVFRLNQLTGQLSQLTDAYVLLGAAFFLGFIMASHRQFTRLLGIMLPVVLAEFLLVVLVPQDQIDIFLVFNAILLTSQIVMLRMSFRRVQLYY